MVHVEIEISSPEAGEQLYDLRNYLSERIDSLQISIKEQPPVEGQMSAFSAEGILNGFIHAGVGIGIEHCIHILGPLISDWLKRKKTEGKKEIEVLATLGDNSGRVSFSEDSEGVTKKYENVSYSIDTARTRAILIGCGEFTNDFSSIPPVKGNLEDLYQVLVDKRNIGLPPENISVAFNKTNTEIEELLLRTSMLPDTETLLLYFSGHGYRSDVDKLHLIASNSRKIENHILSGIDYDFIKKIILKSSPAKQKIVILDACHSGIATQGGPDAIMEVNVEGTYVLASSESDEVSYFDKNKRNTFFTGVLLDTLRKGIDNTNEMLALNDLYENSKTHLDQRQQPRFKDKLSISPADFFIARNPSFSVEKNIQRATALYKAGHLSEALREYRKILKRWPDNVELKDLTEQCNNDLLFSRFMKEGDELFYQSRQYKKALENYEQAYEIRADIALAEKIRNCKEFIKTGISPMSADMAAVSPEEPVVITGSLEEEHDTSTDKKKKQGMSQKVLALIIAIAVVGLGSLLLFLFKGHKEKYSISEMKNLLSTNPSAALFNLRKSKKKDSANYIIGNYHREDKNFDSAAFFYKKAIHESNLPAAYSALGEMYYMGELNDSANLIADSIFRRADSLSKADTTAYYYLGSMTRIKGLLSTGLDELPDSYFQQAQRWYRRGINMGSLRCKYSLALLYLDDRQDPLSAFPFMKEAAEKNITLAQAYLSDMYANGSGISRNEEEAYHWFRSFMNHAMPDELVEIGNKYYRGILLFYRKNYEFKQDCQKAIKLYKAAENNISSLSDYTRRELYLNLSYIYEKGCGGPELIDRKQAISYYIKAAEAGDEAARFRLKELKVNY